MTARFAPVRFHFQSAKRSASASAADPLPPESDSAILDSMTHFETITLVSDGGSHDPALFSGVNGFLQALSRHYDVQIPDC